MNKRPQASGANLASVPGNCVRRQAAHCLLVALAVTWAAPARALSPQSAPAQQSEAAPAAPDQAQDPQSLPKQPNPGSAQSQPAAGTPAPAAPQAAQPAEAPRKQISPAKPVGTAAAPYEKPIGVAASRPAGAAIAPAKQRRTRSLLIKVGVLVGIGVAVGTVAALSHSSPSRP